MVLRPVFLHMISRWWQRQANATGSQHLQNARKETRAFYVNNTALFEKADAVTGDTARQLADFKIFVQRYKREFKNKQVLDIGCGDGHRMTIPMASLLADSNIIAIDTTPPTIGDAPANVVFKKGDFCELPVKDQSIALATAHWSVVNDLILRSQQLTAFRDLNRVLELQGLFYFDVPALEGKAGYLTRAKAYHQKYPNELFGMIERPFPGGRQKRFYIYPRAEITALLDYHGFSVERSWDWTTKSGQARTSFVARKTRHL